MKVILLNGSPHAHGSTNCALEVVAGELNASGIETEIIHVGHLSVRGCISCLQCRRLGHCIFDDKVNEVAAKFEEADGLVVGSPVYYAGAAGTITSFMDRLFYCTSFSKRMKVGAAVASARRAGTIATLDQLNKYFSIAEMPIVSSRYWNEVHGNSPEETLQDAEGMQIMRVLGRNMGFLIKAIRAEKERSGLPEEEPSRIHTNFIR